MSEDKNPWTILGEREVHSTPWIKVKQFDVLNPAGSATQYSTVEFQNLAIGILPLDENYNTWLVGQYRFPINQYSWEMPEGGGKLGIDPLDSAKRELSEETGIKANKWTKIQEFHMSNCVSDEYSILYVAQDLTFHDSHPDEDEQLAVKKVPFNEVFEMVLNGQITDSMTIVAVYKTKYLIDKGLI